jgi:RNase P subunit RPR2
MTTLTINKVCKYHTANKNAISIVEDMRYTFCEVCESNIESWYNDTDEDRVPHWTSWKVSN